MVSVLPGAEQNKNLLSELNKNILSEQNKNIFSPWKRFSHSQVLKPSLVIYCMSMFLSNNWYPSLTTAWLPPASCKIIEYFLLTTASYRDRTCMVDIIVNADIVDKVEIFDTIDKVDKAEVTYLD